MDSPCCSCDKRGCGSYHDICPDYGMYRESKEKERKARLQTSIIDHSPFKRSKSDWERISRDRKRHGHSE